MDSALQYQNQSMLAIQELQNEVSGLMDFKNALLETFPYLHNKIVGREGIGSVELNHQHHCESMDIMRSLCHRHNDHGWPHDNDKSQVHPTSSRNTVVNLSQRKANMDIGTGTAVANNGSSGSSGYGVADSGFSTELSKELAITNGISSHGMKGTCEKFSWSNKEKASRPSYNKNDADDELLFLLNVIQDQSSRLHNDVKQERLSSRSFNCRTSLAEQSIMNDASSRKKSNFSVQFGNSRNIQPTSNYHHLPLGAIIENEVSVPSYRPHPLCKFPHFDCQEQIEEVTILRSERELLCRKVVHLENKVAETQMRIAHLEDDLENVTRQNTLLENRLCSTERSEISRIISTSNSSSSSTKVNLDSGIVHSVQIRTDGARRPGSEFISASAGVNIEIKQRKPESTPVISVVNCGSVVNSGPYMKSFQARHSSKCGDQIAPQFCVNESTGKTKAMPKDMSNLSKSKSVSNLSSERNTRFDREFSGDCFIGLKSSNSEMNVAVCERKAAIQEEVDDNVGRKTVSEMSVDRIGIHEKFKIEAVAGLVSMPIKLTKGQRLKVKPNREKIKFILGMKNVVELQRQLITSVMENEVYKTQLIQMSDTWSSKIGNFEKQNDELQRETEVLRCENERLKYVINENSCNAKSFSNNLNIKSESANKVGDRLIFAKNLDPSDVFPPTIPANKIDDSWIQSKHSKKISRNGSVAIHDTGLSSVLPHDARQRLEKMVASGKKMSSKSDLSNNYILKANNKLLAQKTTTNGLNSGKEEVALKSAINSNECETNDKKISSLGAPNNTGQPNTNNNQKPYVLPDASSVLTDNSSKKIVFAYSVDRRLSSGTQIIEKNRYPIASNELHSGSESSSLFDSLQVGMMENDKDSLNFLVVMNGRTEHDSFDSVQKEFFDSILSGSTSLFNSLHPACS